MKIDLDIKIRGREDEIVEAVRSRGLAERTMTSGTEIPTIRMLGELAPELSRGWTIPRVTRDWTKSRVGKPLVLAGMATLRARLPRRVRSEAPLLGVEVDLDPPRPREQRACRGRSRLAAASWSHGPSTTPLACASWRPWASTASARTIRASSPTCRDDQSGGPGRCRARIGDLAPAILIGRQWPMIAPIWK